MLVVVHVVPSRCGLPIRVESNRPIHNLIISILVKLNCFLSDLLNSFDESVLITVWVIFRDFQPSIDVDDFLPVRRSPWGVILHSFELERVPSLHHQFV